MRAIWSGSIGFGLVNIPVNLYSAVHDSRPDLDMLDKKDHANIRFKRVNAATGKEVAWENIVRGYKLNDRYVVLTGEDLEKVSPEKNKIIEIKEFVDQPEIDSLYYDMPYYLEPGKGGAKAYTLLRDTLKKTKKAGIGTFVLRSRENLVLIKPYEQLLVLNKMRFEEEVRDPAEIKIPKASNSTAEMKMATQLINELSHRFSISRYKDTYSDKLMKLIKAKAKGRKTVQPPLRIAHSRSRDLMSQLKASLESNKRKAS